jgi:tyrosyl-tRNA synthetase
MNQKEKINNLLTRGIEEVIEKKHLEAALSGRKHLRIKHGVDPTGEKIHLGRAISLWKLREFQKLGHKIILIIGDFTAQIGDPSDKLEKRPFLTPEQVKRNLKNYLPQIGKIIDIKKAEIHYNSKWLAKLNFRETAELAESFSIRQMLRRRAFQERWKKDEDISLREFMYPLMQGYDSVMIKADVEIGGADQLFNLLAGRKIQEHYGQKPQDIMTTKMLLGLDGRKMSTSWGNVINITDSPEEQYGKIMSMHDDLIVDYFILTTNLPFSEIKQLETKLKQKKVNPKAIKGKLAFEIVKRYHGEAAAKKAQERFEQLFSKKEFSGDLPLIKLKNEKISALELVLLSGIAKSKSEAWRLIAQGGFKINSEPTKEPKEIISLNNNDVIQIGKKNFFRVKI